ncbi:MAG: hypothetical protein R6U96_04645 [Promethearchaeia archaeon]
MIKIKKDEFIEILSEVNGLRGDLEFSGSELEEDARKLHKHLFRFWVKQVWERDYEDWKKSMQKECNSQHSEG